MQIRVDWDVGFSEDRLYGRGKSGGQVRDEHRGRDEMERDNYPKYGNGGGNGGNGGNGGGRGYNQDHKFLRKREPYEVTLYNSLAAR